MLISYSYFWSIQINQVSKQNILWLNVIIFSDWLPLWECGLFVCFFFFKLLQHLPGKLDTGNPDQKQKQLRNSPVDGQVLYQLFWERQKIVFILK